MPRQVHVKCANVELKVTLRKDNKPAKVRNLINMANMTNTGYQEQTAHFTDH